MIGRLTKPIMEERITHLNREWNLGRGLPHLRRAPSNAAVGKGARVGCGCGCGAIMTSPPSHRIHMLQHNNI